MIGHEVGKIIVTVFEVTFRSNLIHPCVLRDAPFEHRVVRKKRGTRTSPVSDAKGYVREWEGWRNMRQR